MTDETVKAYTLRAKDTALIEFSLYRRQGGGDGSLPGTDELVIDKVHVDQQALFPAALKTGVPLTGKKLADWIRSRKLPRHRHFAEAMEAAIHDDGQLMTYVDVTKALSLNDAYWITATDISPSWADCNLYDHPFEEGMAAVAFTGEGGPFQGPLATPELTTCGALKKCWIRRDGRLYLQKGDGFMPRSDGRTQATLEWYAAQVAEVMELPHIPYELEWYTQADGTKETVCLCELFTCADVGYVDAHTYFSQQGLDWASLDDETLAAHERMAQLYGREAYADLMVFAALICNKDRHYGNYGYLIDNDTGAWIGPAPIFDNGRSLLYDASTYDLDHLEDYMAGPGGRGTSMPFDALAQFFVEPRHLEGLQKLTTFSFENHPTCPLPEVTLARLTNFVRQRAAHIIDLYEAREMHHHLTVTD